MASAKECYHKIYNKIKKKLLFIFFLTTQRKRNREQGPTCAGKETDAALCNNGGTCGNSKEKT